MDAGDSVKIDPTVIFLLYGFSHLVECAVGVGFI